jgi:hypothetical protein
MRCSEARDALLDRELDRELDRKLAPGPTPADTALRAHLAACSECASRASAERLLSEALRELRFDPPPTVDVTERVMQGLPELGRGHPDEVSVRQLGWAAAAAVLCGLALLAGLWRMLPDLSGPAREIWASAASLRHALGSIGSVTATLVSSGLKTTGRLLEGLAPVAGALQGLEPVVIAALATCAAVMAGTIVVVVGRDLRTRGLTERGNTI